MSAIIKKETENTCRPKNTYNVEMCVTIDSYTFKLEVVASSLEEVLYVCCAKAKDDFNTKSLSAVTIRDDSMVAYFRKIQLNMRPVKGGRYKGRITAAYARIDDV